MGKKSITVAGPAYGIPGDTIAFPSARDANDKIVYRIERVRNTTELAPNIFISKQQVDEMCASPDWDVSIIVIKRRR